MEEYKWLPGAKVCLKQTGEVKNIAVHCNLDSIPVIAIYEDGELLVGNRVFKVGKEIFKEIVRILHEEEETELTIEELDRLDALEKKLVEEGVIDG